MRLKYSSILFIIAFFIGIAISCLILYYTKTCVLTYDTKGGTIYQSINVKPGTVIILPEDPVLAGYKFIGWYYNDELIDENMKIYEDTTIKAKYIIETDINKSEE